MLELMFGMESFQPKVSEKGNIFSIILLYFLMRAFEFFFFFFRFERNKRDDDSIGS